MSTITPCGFILACLCVVLTGCGAGWAELVGGATYEVKEKFVARETCPAEQVALVAAARPGWLKDKAATPPPPPSPEIAADPGRTALYYRQHPPQGGESYAGRRFFLAQGCGHSDLYMCDVPSMCLKEDGSGAIVPYACTRCDRIAPEAPAP